MPEGRNPEEASFRELLNVRGIRVYKVIAGGLGTSLRDYNEQARHTKSLPLSDWRALYTQFQRDHTLGTLPYRWEHAREALLVEATIRTPLHILILDGPLWHDGTISGDEKAKIVKKQQKMDATQPLMQGLGAAGKVALVRETQDEWELVMDHDLFASLDVQERVVAQFQRHARLPVTGKWCLGGESDACWKQKWEEDGPDLSEAIPDLPMEWLQKTVSKRGN